MRPNFGLDEAISCFGNTNED
ncbi:hypothetical protein CEXT_601591, partial [Caerostris extrusa]